MATNTDWSKFQRRYLHILLRVQCEIGVGKAASLEEAITALRSEMEPEDIGRVIDELKRAGTI
ncbi:MAG: hypothetical protein FWB91_14310 [Defluviitaleaceae bacterium]|nr:hypothetical protein [Defluviitaleaceae bacterium]